jgi:hypothetical protein
MSLPLSLRIAAVAAASVAVPASANAAIAVSNPAGGSCFLQTSSEALPIGVAVTGLAPAQAVTLRVSRKGAVAGQAAVTADAAGNVNGSITSWFTPLGSKPSKEVAAIVDAVDANGTVLAQANASLANFTYSVTGTGAKRSWKIQGLAALTGSNSYYAHYFKKGKYKGRLSLGKAKGACGYLNVKKPLTPFKKLGAYDVHIQASKKYVEGAPEFTGHVVITHRYR